MSIDGRAVAVAHRNVGLTKTWARKRDCSDRNGNGKIDTSSKPDEVLAFEDDECIAWFLDFPDMTAPRVVAWTPGRYDEASCRYVDQKLWTVTGKGGHVTSLCGAEGLWVHLIDGDRGEIEDTIYIPESELSCDSAGQEFGAPGVDATVDADGNLYFNAYNHSDIARVELDTLNYEIWPSDFLGGGLVIDPRGRVLWTADNAGLRWTDMDDFNIGGLLWLPADRGPVRHEWWKTSQHPLRRSRGVESPRTVVRCVPGHCKGGRYGALAPENPPNGMGRGSFDRAVVVIQAAPRGP